jgi:hypothetical protein
MNSKYIKLSFKNAKIFTKNIKTKDFVSNLTVTHKNLLVLSRSKRADGTNKNFKEPITVHQVSNMLHTLIGERPVPSFRNTFYSRDEKLFSLANDSFIRIDSPKTIKNIKNEEKNVFISEVIRTNKSANNSWAKPSQIHWFKIKKYMGDDFDKFINTINKALEYNVLNESFENLKDAYSIHGSKLDIVINYLKSIKKMPMVNFLTKSEVDRSEITRSSSIGECVNSGIDDVSVLDGEILVPYNDYFVSKLIVNSTNILDGGYVKILGIFYLDEIEDSLSFVKLSEISDEKY